MEQKQFVSLMNSIDLSKVELQICTNGTILPGPELKSLIEKCKKVYLCISLDGIGSVNDWYRWPSKFNEVIDNMKQFEQWWSGSSNIVFIVHHVINAINAIDLPKFINFMNDNFPRWVIEWDWIRWPEWQELSVLPDTTKENLIDQFKKEEKLFKSKHTQNPYGPTISRLLENRTTAWETAIINMFNMSTERQLDLLSMIPNLKNI
jgi:sulfatase maturation enzyme AslB (radical SAM superfamily)